MSGGPPTWMWVVSPPVALTWAVAGAVTGEPAPENEPVPTLPVTEEVQEEVAVDLEGMR